MSAKPGEGLSRFLSERGRGPPARGLASQLDALRFRPYANASLEAEFEERAIMNLEQPARDVDAEIRIDPDQLGVEGCMMDFRDLSRPNAVTA